ncbi:sirohydrochlorin chelatase [Alicycliphilus denitrificans]|uniref:Cobalamin (Vitamin B12) biosynthesis CbiX protein n=1 Tax=Alicycliphilus denitrificans (strain DSM 14773 / CIP 107495 / K601) TaxID=596154 RepID=F4GBE9_ALIDK|nr:CbiX/SirB N-terminal domain-containing protein [Alicycliphilus denitrificans]ADU99907.1 cobalamin (vitamin B12) biosynthesis CbiX protein [Alicycliphilus denitrificans BC]AEB84725.1 cobalamin (vitamin B12) biosynthesis CbiX protein [Alicycliphilus denitrificans K601]GAO23479.1 cobalamin biosynthesis CbiX protein [Alicycliphilus sp. B1]
MQQARAAIILLAHGSRDPLWRQPIEAVAAHIRASQPLLAVRCAYMELCEPGLPAALAELAAQGAARISIVPLFLGAGRHVRDDLPRQVQALAQAHPHIDLRLQPPIGEDDRVMALMAEIAASTAIY